MASVFDLVPDVELDPGRNGRTRRDRVAGGEERPANDMVHERHFRRNLLGEDHVQACFLRPAGHVIEPVAPRVF